MRRSIPIFKGAQRMPLNVVSYHFQKLSVLHIHRNLRTQLQKRKGDSETMTYRLLAACLRGSEQLTPG